MKKLLSLCSLLVSIILIASCSSDDNNEPAVGEIDEISELEKSYFSVENATYETGMFPAATIDESIQGLSINSSALTGGMNFITILSEKAYNKFFVGVKEVPGYWVYDVSDIQVSEEGGYYAYSVSVMYSTEYSSDITMLISGEDRNGNVTTPYEAEIKYVDSKSGDLNINLTFSNDKDIDLHLFTPSGEHIYYAARGGSVETVDGRVVTYGLDHDSNAACWIDHLNNENIYIPAEKIESGTYRIVVDMYMNCKPSIATSWAVVARYKGYVIPTTTGTNPATGVYPVYAGNGDMTTVMEFTINETSTRAGNFLIKPETFEPTPLSDMDEMKLEEAMFRRENK